METFLVATQVAGEGCSWHRVGDIQGGRCMSHEAQDSPPAKHCLAPDKLPQSKLFFPFKWWLDTAIVLSILDLIVQKILLPGDF